MSDAGLAIRQGIYNLQRVVRSSRTLVFTVAMPVMLLLLFNSVFGKSGATTSFFGHDVKLASYYTAGIAAYAVMLTAFSSMVIEIVNGREAGRLKRYRGTPMPPWVFFAGLILYVLVMSIGMVVVLTAVGRIGYGVTIRTEALPALVCYVVLGVFTFTSMAMAISRVVTTPEMASSVGPFSVVGLGFISGVFITADTLPTWLQDLGRALPAGPPRPGHAGRVHPLERQRLPHRVAGRAPGLGRGLAGDRGPQLHLDPRRRHHLTGPPPHPPHPPGIRTRRSYRAEATVSATGSGR